MSRVLQSLVWGLVIVTSLSPGQAEAQRFGVVIGNGGGVRVGIGNGPMYGPYGPGPGYRGYGYGPVGVAIANRPAVAASPSPLVAPQQSPTLASPTPLTIDGGEIVVYNPSSTGQDIRYLLNGQLFTMPAGTKQSIVNDRTWTIQYESSPGTVVTYTLVTARYKFKPTETGVGLFQTQDTPEAAQAASGLPAAPTPDLPESSILRGPIPQPPTPGIDGTVIPSRPALKTTP